MSGSATDDARVSLSEHGGLEVLHHRGVVERHPHPPSVFEEQLQAWGFVLAVEEYVDRYALTDRIDTASLDMFNDPWPSGYDAHFLSNIFHDWGWERCRLLARQSFESLPAGGRIYLHEMLLEDTRDAPLAATSFSMNMIFFTQGKQFTAGELEVLLDEAGFEEITITPTCGYYSLVTGRKR